MKTTGVIVLVLLACLIVFFGAGCTGPSITQELDWRWKQNNPSWQPLPGDQR